MERTKRRTLESAGWRVGNAADFLGLTPAETAFVDLRLALAGHLKEIRRQNGWTQSAVAERLGSSQSRVAKMEASDPSVSLDLMVRSLLALGATCAEVGRVIAQAA